MDLYKIALIGLGINYLVSRKIDEISAKLRFGIKKLKYIGFVNVVNPTTGANIKAAKFTAVFSLTNRNAEPLSITQYMSKLMYGADGISIINLKPAEIPAHGTSTSEIEILVSSGDIIAALAKLLLGTTNESDPTFRGLHVAGYVAGKYNILPFSSNFDEPVVFNLATLAPGADDTNVQELIKDFNL